MNSIALRIKKLIDEKKLNISSFERKIGVGNNSIGTIINKNSNVSGAILSKILNSYADVNANWLITGKGEMLHENEEKPLLNNLEETSTTGTTLKLLDENYSMLQQKTKMQEEIIAMLREKIDFTQQKLEDCEKEKKLFAHIKKMD